jgi:DUF971 family protein
MEALRPTRLEVIGTELAIAWSDGAETFLPLDLLRRSCPCASCSGEPDLLGNILKPAPSPAAPSTALRSIRTVGGYAVQPVWADGHSSGIYSFEFLRALAAASPGT